MTKIIDWLIGRTTPATPHDTGNGYVVLTESDYEFLCSLATAAVRKAA